VVDKRNEIGFKRCPECFEIVPYRAKICPTCRSYQDWRRYIAINQPSLALLVALLSVATTFGAVVVPLLKDSGSSIDMLLTSSAEHKATFLARNEGRESGVVVMTRFKLFVKRPEGFASLEFQAARSPQLVTVEKQTPFEIEFDAREDAVWNLLNRADFFKSFGSFDPNEGRAVVTFDPRIQKMTAKLTCSFVFSETSFRKPNVFKELIVDCYDLSWMRQALHKGLSHLK
jgi:hypothetical protein